MGVGQVAQSGSAALAGADDEPERACQPDAGVEVDVDVECVVVESVAGAPEADTPGVAGGGTPDGYAESPTHEREHSPLSSPGSGTAAVAEAECAGGIQLHGALLVCY